MADLKTYSVVIAWNDNDPDQGDYGMTVRATDPAEAEAKVRAMMPTDDQFGGPARCVQCGCTDNDGSDICPDCGGAIEDNEPREYGRLLDCTEGAIWKAADLEKALRRLLACPDLNLDELEPETVEAIDAASKIIAEIDAL